MTNLSTPKTPKDKRIFKVILNNANKETQI